MKTEIYDLWDSIPSVRKPVFNSYDNKKLKRWSPDDFANFVFDHCNLDYQLSDGDTFVHNDPWFAEMCRHIPIAYGRVFLYGVWDCVSDKLKREYKEKHRS